jgi:predicted nucleic acid-binding Zn ribbon protein
MERIKTLHYCCEKCEGEQTIKVSSSKIFATPECCGKMKKIVRRLAPGEVPDRLSA